MNLDLPPSDPQAPSASPAEGSVSSAVPSSLSSRPPRPLSIHVEGSAAGRSRGHFLPHLILAFGLVLTAVSTVYLDVTMEAHDTRRFRATAEQIQRTIESRLDLYVALLKAGAEAFAARPLGSAEEFREQIDALKLHFYPREVRRLGFSRRVPPADRARFEGEARRREASFHLYPEPLGDAFPIVDLEPRDPQNSAVLGFDLSSDPVRWAAMERAGDTGVPVATDRVTLTAETEGEAASGVVIYAPVYEGGDVPDTVERRRAALSGFVFLAFSGDDLFQGIFGDRARHLSVDVELYDGAERRSESLVLRSSESREGGTVERGDSPRFTSASVLTFAGRPFHLTFASRPEFERASGKALGPFILAVGLFLSVAFFVALRAGARARALADASTMDRRISERALREGERKLQRLYRAEGEARHSAEVATRVRDEFLATLSHELRTPLTSMMGWIQMIRGRGLDPSATTRGLEVIERNVKLQAQLVEDLLDVSQLITGKLRVAIRPVLVAPIVSAAVDAVRPAASARAIHLSITGAAEKLWVAGDPDRLQQVFWNLLSNAIRFTPLGGRVDVRLALRGGQVEIAFSDSGRGISPEFLPFVFDRFRQADSTVSRVSGGLGLGLAIVRHLVELHGGTVSAASPGEGRGAIFTVALPVTAPEKK